MQTILGAGGSVGKELATELVNYTKEIRLVNRHPKKVNETDQLFPADLLNTESLDKAVEGSEIVYVTIAFKYKASVWEENWPRFINNLIQSCKKHNAKIVFVDNIYMYDRDHLQNMTEKTPINPSSKKGKIRAEIAGQLLNAAEKKEVNAMIARSADFYGPNVIGSLLTQSVLNNLRKDKSPQWIGKLDVVHSFTNTRDIGKAVALLGNTADAYNQTWHMPTFEGKLTSRQWIELVMKTIKKNKKIQAMPVWSLGIMGLFIPILKEIKEMSYQLDRDYYFNSSKFNKEFHFTPITPEEGIKEMVNS